MTTTQKSLLATLLATTVVGSATAAAAGSVEITAAGIYDPIVLDVTVPGQGPELEDATAIDLTAIVAPNTKPQTLYVFCADLFRDISVGLNTQKAVGPLNYQTGVLTTDSSGTAPGTGVKIGSTASKEIDYLVGLGVDDAKANTPDSHDFGGGTESVALAGIQGAIWSIEYNDTPGVQITGLSAAISAIETDITAAQNFVSSHPGTPVANAIYSTTDGFVSSSQGFTGGVPEPAAWAMMIAGFGLVGATLRRRRAATAATA